MDILGMQVPGGTGGGITGASSFVANNSIWATGASEIDDDPGFTRTGASGRYLFGATDNGSDKLQVNGASDTEGFALQRSGSDVLRVRTVDTAGFLFTVGFTGVGQGTLQATGLSFDAADATSAGIVGGSLSFSSGNGFTSGSGGNCTFNAGAGGTTGAGAVCSFSAGSGGVTSGDGGAASMTSGSAATSGNGGNVNLSAGNGNGAAGNAGIVNITLGKHAGTGTVSYVLIQTNGIDTRNNSIADHLILFHRTSGSPAVGIGVGMLFRAETAANNNEDGAAIQAVTTDVTSTSEDFDLVFRLMTAGAAHAEKFRMKADSTFQIAGTQILTTRRTGWTAPTGTTSRAGYDTTTATLTQVAQTLKALIDDCVTHGLIGA